MKRSIRPSICPSISLSVGTVFPSVRLHFNTVAPYLYGDVNRGFVLRPTESADGGAATNQQLNSFHLDTTRTTTASD